MKNSGDVRNEHWSILFAFWFIVLICVVSCPLFLPADTSWEVLKTGHFEVFYKKGQEEKARECLTVLTVYRDNVKKLTGKEIPKLRVVLEDIGTMSNAFADPLNPNIHIYLYPPEGTVGGLPGIGFSENWWRSSGIHESIHIAQLTNTSGFPAILTTLFGNIFSPNLVIPGWIAEGVTVSGESRLSPYEGRLNDGFFDTLMLSLVSDGKLPSLLEMTYTPFDFPSLVGGEYFYGGLFLNYLSEKYGQEKLNEFFKNQGGSFWAFLLGSIFPAVGIDNSARKTYGRPFKTLHQEYLRDLVAKSRPFAIDGTALTNDKLTVYSNLFITTPSPVQGDCHLYYIKREFHKTGAYDIHQHKSIMRRAIPNIETEEELVSTTSSFSTRPHLAVDDNGSPFLYYTVLEYKRGFANSTNLSFGFISNLHQKDLTTLKDRILFSDTIRSFCVLSGNILYAKDRQDKFGSELYLYDIIGKRRKLLGKTDFLVGEMTTSSSPLLKNQVVVSARYDWENWGLYLLDTENLSLEELVNTPYAETSPSISEGRVFFVANYDKTYRIYAYDLSTKKLYQITTGSYAHFPTLYGKELYFVGLNSGGTNLYHKPLVLTEIRQPQYQPSPFPGISPRESELLANSARQGDYLDVLKTMLPSYRIPLFRKNSAGASLSGYDVTYEHSYTTRLLFGKTPYFAVSYENLLLKPMIIGAEHLRRAGKEPSESKGEQDTKVYGRYPAYLSLEPGLSALVPSLEIRHDERGGLNSEKMYSTNELVPGMYLGLRYPRWYLMSQLNCVIERKGWDSMSDRNALESISLFSHHLPNLVNPEYGGELNVFTYLINDPDNKADNELVIRGYDTATALKTRSGGILNVEYSAPFQRSRQGWWNPNIYWEDMVLVGFTDCAFGESEAPLYSIGAEVRLEAALGFNIRFIPIAGIAINKKGESEVYISLMLTTNIGSSNTLSYPESFRDRRWK
ncbi:MAG: hypothetical protein QME51_02230 [Planctomycetota bacterium]|nr:hypothetical protein [Planctomycetota bacterium]MDI6787171.1 hypothetical protein [Planctomycetota bacterium]